MRSLSATACQSGGKLDINVRLKRQGKKILKLTAELETAKEESEGKRMKLRIRTLGILIFIITVFLAMSATVACAAEKTKKLVASEKTYNAEGDLIAKMTYKYDQYGNLISYKSKSRKDVHSPYTEYSYKVTNKYKKGQLIKKVTVYNSGSKVIETFTYKKGLLKKSVQKSNGKVLLELYYDKYGHYTDEYFYPEDGSKKQHHRHKITYKNGVRKTEKFLIDGGYWNYFIYDKYGNIKEATYKFGTKTTYKYKNQYKNGLLKETRRYLKKNLVDRTVYQYTKKRYPAQ